MSEIHWKNLHKSCKNKHFYKKVLLLPIKYNTNSKFSRQKEEKTIRIFPRKSKETIPIDYSDFPCYNDCNIVFSKKPLEGLTKIVQKQAFSVQFEALPVSPGDTLYFDAAPVSLPYAEDFPMLHYHDRYEIGICYDGEGIFISEGVFSYFSKGDVMFIPPNAHHYARSIRKTKPLICRFVYINTDTVESLINFINKDKKRTTDVLSASKSFIPSVIHSAENTKVNAMLTDLIETCSPDEQNLTTLIELKTALFLFEAYKTFGNKSKNVIDRYYKMDAGIDAVAEYISLNYDKSTGISELAKLCLLSESQLRRRFTKVYGTTPIAYRQQLRCKIAAELLLRTRFSIQKISDRVGFTDVSDLYKAFKKVYGMAPSEYRAKKSH